MSSLHTIDRLPGGVIKLRYIWNWRALISRESLTAIEQPHKATLRDATPSCSAHFLS